MLFNEFTLNQSPNSAPVISIFQIVDRHDTQAQVFDNSFTVKMHKFTSKFRIRVIIESNWASEHLGLFEFRAIEFLYLKCDAVVEQFWLCNVHLCSFSLFIRRIERMKGTFSQLWPQYSKRLDRIAMISLRILSTYSHWSKNFPFYCFLCFCDVLHFESNQAFDTANTM